MMTRYFYNGASLEHVLGVLEERYGLSSEDFYEAHVAGAPLEHIPRFHQHVWASFYREARTIGASDGFASRAQRVFELAL